MVEGRLLEAVCPRSRMARCSASNVGAGCNEAMSMFCATKATDGEGQCSHGKRLMNPRRRIDGTGLEFMKTYILNVHRPVAGPDIQKGAGRSSVGAGWVVCGCVVRVVQAA